MPLDLKQFTGATPYASELFGVYQPILGWKSKRKRRWIGRQQQALLAAAADKLRTLAPARAALLANPKALGRTDVMSHAIEDWADTEVGRGLQAAAIDFVAKQQRLPEPADWKAITGSLPKRLCGSSGLMKWIPHLIPCHRRASGRCGRRAIGM